MSERVKIAAEPRAVTGKRVKQLRRDNLIPAVIYGQLDPLHIQFNRLELRRALRQAGRTNLLEISVGSQTRTVLTRDVQQHPTRGDVLHVDFYEVDLESTVVVEVPVVGQGMSRPEADGLGITSLMHLSLEVECKPDDLPDQIVVDLSVIQDPDDTIHVRDLPLPAGVVLLEDPDNLVAKFEFHAIVEEEEEEEELEAFVLEPSEDEGEAEDEDQE